VNKETPFIQQYRRIKSRYQSHILFFRLGDFYEMFETDAIEVSDLLGLTLTMRNGIKMCGVPHHVAATYLEKLIKAGKKVAVCEQMEGLKDGGNLIAREVTEIITPGTYTEINHLAPHKNNFLLSLHVSRRYFSAVWIDISTGDFVVLEQENNHLIDLVAALFERIHPRELIVQESVLREYPFFSQICKRLDVLVNSYPDWLFDKEKGFERACKHFQTVNLKAFEIDDSAPVLAAIAALLDYLDANFHSSLVHVQTITVEYSQNVLRLNEAAQRNLELLTSLSSGKTLFHILNNCKTPMGERMLRSWITAPLREKKKIDRRLDVVGGLLQDQHRLQLIQSTLRSVSDIERLLSRLGMQKAHPQDLMALASACSHARKALFLMKTELSMLAVSDVWKSERITQLIEKIKNALVTHPPVQHNEGGIIADRYDKELDSLRHILRTYETRLHAYLEEEKKKTKITSLKLRNNRVLGVFFEVANSQTHLVPSYFLLRQTVSTGKRYLTEDLQCIAQQHIDAQERVNVYEQELFVMLRNDLLQYLKVCFSFSKIVARVDVLQSFAWNALLHDYKRPAIINKTSLVIKGGRHPVVERCLQGHSFIPNDVVLDEKTHFFRFITGPNMAGKSTYLRQTALIVVMAQMGCFVPAQETEIGIVDQIFCRVGSSDNITKGESTFLVEMMETSAVLHAATCQSLIIMDEVGRGTSTLDGLALAWSISEHILDKIRARTLFATHYHELAELKHEKAAVFSICAQKEEGKIVFLHTLQKGLAEASYGIDVAQLAGVPDVVLQRAYVLLSQLSVKHTQQKKTAIKELNYNKTIVKKTQESKETVRQQELFSPLFPLYDEMEKLDVDNLTPLDAFQFLVRLKKKLSDKENE